MDLGAVEERAGPRVAKLFAQIRHGRRKPTNSLWVVPQPEVGEVSADEAEFGGTTDKSYRWTKAYRNVDADFAEEVAESQEEQETAEAQRGDA